MNIEKYIIQTCHGVVPWETFHYNYPFLKQAVRFEWKGFSPRHCVFIDQSHFTYLRLREYMIIPYFIIRNRNDGVLFDGIMQTRHYTCFPYRELKRNALRSFSVFVSSYPLVKDWKYFEIISSLKHASLDTTTSGTIQFFKVGRTSNWKVW